MEGRYPAGVRLVWANCTVPAQREDFNRWYDRVHIPDLLAARVATRGLRFENAEPAADAATYLAIYELERPDLENADQDFARARERLAKEGRMHPALDVVGRGTWRRVGPPFSGEQHREAEVRGIWIVESVCTEPAREDDFNRWYDAAHIPDLLGTGLFEAAYRFVALDGGTYLAIYETTGDPIEMVQEFVRAHRPRLREQGRLSELINVTQRATFRRLKPLI